MRFQVTLALATLAALSACKRAENASIDSAGGAVTTGQSTAATSATSTTAESPAAAVTGFIKAVDNGEVETGNTVSGKARNAEVKAFAQQIVRDHTALQQKVDEYTSAHGISPTVPGPDDPLMQDHQKSMSNLSAMKAGKAYDRAFVKNEVDMHQKALDKVKEALGNNPDADLRKLLEMAQGGIAGHLAKAQQLEKKLGG